MKKKRSMIMTAGMAVLILTAMLFKQCGTPHDAPPKINPAFSAYISAFTSGVISAVSGIRIKLSEAYQNPVEIGEEIDDDLFEFDPDIEGKLYWLDSRTIEFVPDKNLPSGTVFNAEFYISRLLDVPGDLRTFEFQFQTIRQSFSFHKEGMKTYDKNNLQWNKLLGSIVTADVIDDDEIEKVMSATQDEEDLSISWEHGSDMKQHKFQVDSIIRRESEGNVLITWNGDVIGIESKGSDTLEVPALGDFKLMDIRVVQQPEQYVLLQFSDPLQERQNLQGLIRMENTGDLKFIIEDNEIRVYPPVRQTGKKEIILEPGIKNILSYKSPDQTITEITFEEIKPAVRLIGKGVILPKSDGLIFPFEAVNLSSIDLRIIKIFENNIAQFLQVNQLDGSSQLKRVGRLILKKRVQLTSSEPLDYGKWNAFSIDLSKLIEAEPGAIYKVEIGFRKQYSLYSCPGESEEDSELEELEESWDEDDETELSYWDNASGYYSYDSYYYGESDWSQRDNPCHSAYYGSRRKVSSNILASDLGVIAKAGNNKTMTFAVTDLRTTEPLADVTLEVYNYQQQLLKTVITDKMGMAKLDMKETPFLLIAKKGEQRGYLRLDDGSSLSLSRFDVSGNQVQKGIKGYIYGERGVWRPGDSLFVMFILEDKEQLLPKTHPVSLELVNPQSQLVHKAVLSSGVNGFYNFSTATGQDAPTGNWTATVRVGGATFSKTIKIETIKPNRLKINLDFGVEKLSVGQSNVAGDLSVKWLHGAVAKNLKAMIAVTLVQAGTSFKKYADFIFDDPVRRFDSEEQILFDGKIDEGGEAKVWADISVTDAAPGMLKANFVCRVFEESGDFSIDRFSIPYSPYTSFVGIKLPKGDKTRGMLLTDTNHIVEVVTIDPDGKPVSRDGLEVEVYKVNWRWWWDASDDNLASYVGRSHTMPVHSEKISTSNGKGQFKLRVDYPAWGRYLVRIFDPVSGHCTGRTVYIDWPGWAGRAQRDQPGAASMLTFSSDKNKYQVGEFATITFPAGGVGRALVSIESGSKVIDAYWVEPQKGETTFNFKVTDEMAPNVYLHLTLLQPHAQTANDLPIRLYGVIPIMVEDPATKLHPEIDMPDVLVPEEDVTIKIKEQEGKPMTYTIAVVDEGLLDLTRFKTPDPWSSFYAREALGVRTWDMYDMVMGAYGGKLEQIFSIGGDEALGGKGKKKAIRFKPMVKFLGPFELGSRSSNTHTFKMPQYVGSVRTMIIAGEDGAYGFAEKTTPVRKPLMVLATLPRVVGPGETVKLPVTIFAMEKKVKNVTVEVVTNEYFSLTGSKKKSITFSEIGDQVVNFELQVSSRLGIGTVKVIARSGSEKAEYDIEIDVRNPNPKVVDYVDAVIEAGQTWVTEYQLIGMAGTNKGVLEVSNIPPIDFGRRLKFLIGYPHGCVEQTTSSVFPQLFLADVMEVDEKMEQKISDNVKAGISRLQSFLLSNGGLGYWANASSANDWGTSYAGHFMLEAEARGYTLPAGFIKKWKKYQKKVARNWSPLSKKTKYYYSMYDLIQAYRLYTLALAKAPEMGAMNRLRESADLSLQARWRLAAAYVLAGQPEVAKELTGDLATDVKEYCEMSYTYGSSDRDRAMILETMSLMGERSKVIPLMQKVSNTLSSARWLSTQTTAYCLIAMSKFAGSQGTSKELNFTYGINGGKSVNAITELSVSQVDMGIKGTQGGKVEVANNGEGIIYARVTLEGIPETGDQTSSENNLKLTIVYKNMKGYAIDVSALEQGTDFMAEVTLRNPGILGHYKEMALTQIFPSGWEIINTRLDGFESVYAADVPTYQDIRDDRVYTYFDVLSGKTKTYRVLLNAAYLGKFYLPTVYCEAMYDNRINARKPGKWVEVVRAGGELEL
ncbi:MAG: MG2 domain-containing protein [Bacteroidota bacterium]